MHDAGYFGCVTSTLNSFVPDIMPYECKYNVWAKNNCIAVDCHQTNDNQIELSNEQMKLTRFTIEIIRVLSL